MTQTSTAQALRDAKFAALRAKDTATSTLLGGVLANVAARGKDAEGGPREPTEADAVAAVRDAIKKADETAANFDKLGRADEAGKARAQSARLSGFLPQAPGADQLAAAIDAALAGMPGAGMKDMGKVMAVLGEQFGAALDRAAAAPIVKAKLSAAKG